MLKKQFSYLVLCILASCGGGGGGGGGSVNSTFSAQSILQGTAATGAPIVNGVVTIQDSKGNIVTTTTNSAGAYTVDISKLTPPLVIKLEGNNSDASTFSLYSAVDSIASNTQTTANITPLTNATLLIATGQTGADFYANPNPAAITSQALSQANQSLKNQLTNVISATNTSSQVDFIKTDFSANKSNLDLLMEYVNIKNKPPVTAGSPSSVAVLGKLSKGGVIITPPTGGVLNGSVAIDGSLTNQNLPNGIDFSKIDTLISQANTVFSSGLNSASAVSSLVALSDPSFSNNGMTSSDFWTKNLSNINSSTSITSFGVVGCNFGSPFICDISGLVSSGSNSNQFKLTVVWNGNGWSFYGNHKSTDSRVVTTLFRETYFTSNTITRHPYSGFEVVVSTEGTTGSQINNAKLYLLKNSTWQMIDTITDHFGSPGSSFIYKEVQLTDGQIDDFYKAAITSGISSKLEMYDAASNLIATDYVYGIDLPLKSTEIQNVQIPEITDTGIQQFRDYVGGTTLQLTLDPKTGFFSPSQFTWNQFSSAGQQIIKTDLTTKSKNINIILANTVNMPKNRNRGIDFYGYDSEGRPFHTRNVGCNDTNCISGTP
jgi:hypothetical protein